MIAAIVAGLAVGLASSAVLLSCLFLATGDGARLRRLIARSLREWAR